MSDKKWTPGPWVVYADDEVVCRGVTVDQGYPTVIIPDSGAFDSCYEGLLPSRQQIKNNARLIAAAPEMYALLDDFPGFTASLQEKAAWAQRVIETKRKARGE